MWSPLIQYKRCDIISDINAFHPPPCPSHCTSHTPSPLTPPLAAPLTPPFAAPLTPPHHLLLSEEETSALRVDADRDGTLRMA